MPRMPERRGLAYHRAGHHQAFRDGIGHVYRPGAATFVMMAFVWSVRSVTHWGKAPARLLRLFMYEDEEDEDMGERRLMAEVAWGWDSETISTLPEHDVVVPPDIIESMKQDNRCFVESDLVTAEEFESITSDSSIYRQHEVDLIPDADGDARICLGCISLELHPEDGTKVKKVI